MKQIKAVYGKFCRIEEVLCSIGLVILVLLILLSAVCRAAKVSMAWNIDMAMLLLAWTAFLGADIAYRHGQLLGVDLFTRNLPLSVRKVIQILVYICMLVGLVTIGYYGAWLVDFEKARTFNSIPIPYSVVNLSITVTAFSMIISTVVKLKDCFLNLRKAD